MPLLCGNNAAVNTLQNPNQPPSSRPSQQNDNINQSSEPSLFQPARRSFSMKVFRSARKAKTFGVSLNGLPTMSASLIPSILARIAKYLEEQGGFESEGIFRVAGSKKAIDMLKARIDECPDLKFEQFKEVDVNVVAGLMKAFFRDLPQALVDIDQRQRLVLMRNAIQTAIANGNEAEEIEQHVTQFRDKIHELPSSNLAVLAYTMRFLNRLAQHAQATKMNIHNLALIFSQIIFRDEAKIDMSRSFNFATESSSLVEFLIRHCEAIFGQEAFKFDGSQEQTEKKRVSLVVRPAVSQDVQVATLEHILEQHDASDSESETAEDSSSQDAPMSNPVAAKHNQVAHANSTNENQNNQGSEANVTPLVPELHATAPDAMQPPVGNDGNAAVTPTVTPQPPGAHLPTTPGTPDVYSLLSSHAANLTERPQSADSLVRDSPDYRQLHPSALTPSARSSAGSAQMLLAGSPQTPMTSVADAVSPLGITTPTSDHGVAQRMGSTPQDPGRSLRDRLTYGCNSVMYQAGFKFATLSILQHGRDQAASEPSRLVLSSEEPPLVKETNHGLAVIVGAPQATQPTTTLLEVPNLQHPATNDVGPTSDDDQPLPAPEEPDLERLPDRKEADEPLLDRVQRTYKQLAKIVQRFEREFEQTHDRKPTRAERDTVSAELLEYRRLKDWYKGKMKSTTKTGPPSNEQRDQRAAAALNPSSSVDNGTEVHEQNGQPLQHPRGSESDRAATPEGTEGPLIDYRAVRKAYERWRAPFGWAKRARDMDCEQIERDKAGLKRLLAQFDHDFEAEHGRSPSRSDKEALRPLYQRYKELKLALKHAVSGDQLRSERGRAESDAHAKPQRADADVQDSIPTRPNAGTKASTELNSTAQTTHQHLDASNMAEHPLGDLAGTADATAEALEKAPEQADVADLTNVAAREADPAVTSKQEPLDSDVQSLEVDTQSKAALKREKHLLQKLLFKFQSEFEAEHGRKPRSKADRLGYEEQFARYKQLKKRLADET
eukprot:TRINITY_DN11570_c0_g1_i1.p1 TRINITY_DN11570_c0_g1~~TRINITY_DN11570_c0_g1_i1.p1  ORF type:complete len:1005 (+),score=185.77 TRINITY_DN11570_c0_g1_i1:50-3064(+)